MFINHIIFIAITICYYAILVMSLNIAIGYTGIINLAHVAFFAVGAYTTAILTGTGVPFLVAFTLSFAVAAVLGYVFTWITKRLDGDYVALATLGLSFVVYSIILNWKGLTKGPLGIPGIAKPEIFGFSISSNVSYLIFSLIVLGLVTWFLQRLMSSRYGTVLQAIRDDHLGAAMLGKNVFKMKMQAMMLSAGFAGIAGALFAHFITYIHPTNFFLSDIILMVSIVIIGGLASLRGSIVATILLITLTESLRFLPLPAAVVGPMRLMVYAIALILILRFRPRGLFGKVDLE